MNAGKKLRRVGGLAAATLACASLVVAPIALADDTTGSGFTDGTYKGTAAGYKSDITVEVVVESGKISKLDVVSQDETPEYWEMALDVIPAIIEKQGVDVDSISGATKSADAIKGAVRRALNLGGVPDPSIFASGDGSMKNPFIISTKEQFIAFADSVDSDIDYENTVIGLANDIDLSGDDWIPIGGFKGTNHFNGTFEGGGHTIMGLTMGSASKPLKIEDDSLKIGLFGTLGAKAVIQNLNLADVDINVENGVGTMYGGCIAGTTSGGSGQYTGAHIIGCSASGRLALSDQRGNIWAGGLVGMAFKGSALNCASNVSITANEHAPAELGPVPVDEDGDEEENWVEAGGIFGLNFWGLVANSYSLGDVYADYYMEGASDHSADKTYIAAGGISGLDYGGAVVNAYTAGDVKTGHPAKYVASIEALMEAATDNEAHIVGCFLNKNTKLDNGGTVTPASLDNIAIVPDRYKTAPIVIKGNAAYDPAKPAALASSLNERADLVPVAYQLDRYDFEADDLDSWKVDTERGLAVLDNATETSAPTLAQQARDAKVSSVKAKTGSKQLAVSWKATYQGKAAVGLKYQISYRIAGKGSWKTKTTSANAGSYTVKSLKKGKKYQVKVRTYSKTGNTATTGAWSKTITSAKVK